MVDFSYLEKLDFFSRPVKIYFSRLNKKSMKKSYRQKHGTYFGLICSMMAVSLLAGYILFQGRDITNGVEDSLELDVINHDFGNENITMKFSSNQTNSFFPLMEFTLHNDQASYNI